MARTEAYITGIGQSQIGQKLTRHPLLLTRDAFMEALADAGLRADQIDGVATYPGGGIGGFSPIGTDDVIEGFGLNVRWRLGAAEISSQLGAIAAAGDAVKAGHARHILCFRTVYEAAGAARPDDYPYRPAERVDGLTQWLLPFNALSAVNWVATYAMRHVKWYGLRREQLAQIVLTGRSNALLNPRALIRQPLSLDEYLASPPISTPLCRDDCDRYTDASTVMIVSAGSVLDEVARVPIRIAASSGTLERVGWDQADWMASYATGKDLWKRTDYRPKDVKTVQLYDGFSFLALTWLEGLGFCGVGEGGTFIEGGSRIALGGELPMNTFGGQLGAGRLHGFGFAHEAVVQLRGEGGIRQIAGDPTVAIATSGGGPLATALLLARD